MTFMMLQGPVQQAGIDGIDEEDNDDNKYDDIEDEDVNVVDDSVGSCAMTTMKTNMMLLMTRTMITLLMLLQGPVQQR